VFDQIKSGGAKTSKMKSKLEIGVDTLPKLPRDAGDRNRTSPFAFTGNRFEFRAVGSNMAISDPLVAVNTAIAESLDYVATKLEAALAGGKKLNLAIQDLLAEIITQHGAVCFDGNGYSAEWHAEAEKRGLPNYKTTIDALPVLTKPDVIALFDKYKVLSPRELQSRYEIALEQYCKTVNVEANLTAKLAKTTILPAAFKYQTKLAENVAAVKAAGVAPDTSVLGKVTELIGKLQGGLSALETATGHHAADVSAEAKQFCKEVLPAMLKVREAADALEGVVSDEIWPLPTYQEMLFIK
jgi:glutamine synthetase